ncbi:ATP-binding protein [Streptomyces sp. NPDC006235]|uniref:ATP-binding protein n=1 Tax=Streptomyces sp. NPDC006235 TaxID=3156736 RepID=UPI0033A94995
MVIPLMKQAADEQGMGEHATLRSDVAWDSGAASAAEARRVLRAFLARAPLTGRPPVPALPAMDAELIVSELATNAIRHAPGPCGLVLQLTAGALAITVWDTSPDEPVVRKGDRHRVGGHGLHLVHKVSDTVVVGFRTVGKQITAHLRLPPHRGDTMPTSAPEGRPTIYEVGRAADE